MAIEHILLLIAGGLAAGFVAGVIGVGGGIIFAPVLYYYFESMGVDETILAPLVIGSSLFCTLIASLASSWFHQRRDAVDWVTAFKVGLSSSVAVFLMTRFVTTQPWFNGDLFKVAFSIVLLAVVARMLSNVKRGSEENLVQVQRSAGFMFGIGSATGVVSATAGVGGGVVLIPAFHQGLGMTMIRSIGSSSGTIIFVALAGVLSYMFMGSSTGVTQYTIGFVDTGTSLLLVLPSIVTVRLGVHLAHKVDRKVLQLGFAGLALIVAFKLISGVIWV